MSLEPKIIGNTDGLRPEVVEKLFEVSSNTGKPVTIVSGYDKRAGTSAHNYGLAVDVSIPGYNSEQIAAELARAGFRGIGVYHNKDGTLTNTAHGDIRGEEAAKGTPYFKKYGKRTTWNAHDVGGGPGKRKWKYSTREWTWGRGKPSEVEPAPTKPVQVKPVPARGNVPRGGKTAKIALTFIILILVIAVILITYEPFQEWGGGGGESGIAGTWVSPPTTFRIASDFNTFDGSLEDIGTEDRVVTWVITSTGTTGVVEIEQTFTYTNRNFWASGYTPDVSPTFYTGEISSSNLTVKSGSRIVGTFTISGNTITGTWNDEWSIAYAQRVYTETNGLTLTKH